jgi:hypothetical protein
MEDTPTTRRSTSERVGPWFVLQRKNPTAPGLRYSVLLALIKRGHVTPKSILRGPTSSQLWKLAAQMKGVSRLFGLCWHCQASVSPEAISCPRCKSPQDISGDPDAFVETAPVIPVIREVPSPVEPVEVDDFIGSTSLEPQPEPMAAPRPSGPVPVSVTENIMTARELAQVFQLDPKNASFPKRVSRTLGRLIKIGFLVGLLLGTAATAAVLLIPGARSKVKEFAKPVLVKLGLASTDRSGSSPAVVGPSTTAPATQSTLPSAMPTPVVPPSMRDPISPLPVDTVTPTTTRSPAAPSLAAPAAVAPSGVPDADPVQQAVDNAMQLRRQAIEAESAEQWEAAVWLYEEIEKLPESVRPSDSQQRLAIARAKAAEQKANRRNK